MLADLTTGAPADGSNLDAHHDRKSIVDAHAVEFSKTVKPPERCFLRRRPTRPASGDAFAGERRSIALSRAQASESTLSDLQHPPVRAVAGHIVLTGPERALTERHGALIDQPPRLRAGHTELVGDQ